MNFKEWMDFEGITANELAQVLGVSRKTIVCWRSDTHRPAWPHMIEIMKQSGGWVKPNDFI